MSKYGHISHGVFEAVINKMGGEDVMRGFLRDEYKLTPIAKAVAILMMVGTVTIAPH